MIKTVVREHHWTPDKIKSLYLDDIDFLGLKWWYDDVIETIEEIKKRNKK